MARDAAIVQANAYQTNAASVPALGEGVPHPGPFDTRLGWVAEDVRLRWRALKPA